MPPVAHVDGSAEFVRATVLCSSRDRFHRMAFTDWGRGGERGTVVCVHGLTRQGRDFDALARELAAQGYRVICPDLVGRGLSDRLADPTDYDLPQYVLDVTTLLASVGATQVAWVGCSLGGLIGLIVAGMSNSPAPGERYWALPALGGRIADRPFYACRAGTLYLCGGRYQLFPAPFGRLTEEQWQHLAKHSVVSDGGGGYRLRYDPLIVRGLTHQQALVVRGPDRMPDPGRSRSRV
jgi:hypothetical protein